MTTSPEPRVILPICRYILPNGSLCRCIALRGEDYCRHHLELAAHLRAIARARRTRRHAWQARLDAAETPAQQNIWIQYAIQAGELDPKAAAVLVRALRMRARIERAIARQANPPASPKSFRLYQMPATRLFSDDCE